MAELSLETIEEELFDAGLDGKRISDEYEDDTNIYCVYWGEQRIELSPLWAVPTNRDDDDYFFDSDDLVVSLFVNGSLDGEAAIYPESAAELVETIEKILRGGLDSLRESS